MDFNLNPIVGSPVGVLPSTAPTNSTTLHMLVKTLFMLKPTEVKKKRRRKKGSAI